MTVGSNAERKGDNPRKGVEVNEEPGQPFQEYFLGKFLRPGKANTGFQIGLIHYDY